MASSTVLAMNEPSQKPKDEPRLVLHASATNIYFVLIVLGAIALVTVLGEIWRIWSEAESQRGLGFLAGVAVFLSLMLLYAQSRTRWLIARPSGLTIVERRGPRVVPWREVKLIDDLGYWGSSPGAKRYFIEFRDGRYFTFMGDTDAMARLEKLREGWTRASRAEVA